MLNKGRDGWVPFDEMMDHIREGIKDNIMRAGEEQQEPQPISRTALQEYIALTLAELASSYATVRRYQPLDYPALHSINGRARALYELGTRFGLLVDMPDCFRG